MWASSSPWSSSSSLQSNNPPLTLLISSQQSKPFLTSLLIQSLLLSVSPSPEEDGCSSKSLCQFKLIQSGQRMGDYSAWSRVGRAVLCSLIATKLCRAWFSGSDSSVWSRKLPLFPRPLVLFLESVEWVKAVWKCKEIIDWHLEVKRHLPLFHQLHHVANDSRHECVCVCVCFCSRALHDFAFTKLLTGMSSSSSSGWAHPSGCDCQLAPDFTFAMWFAFWLFYATLFLSVVLLFVF